MTAPFQIVNSGFFSLKNVQFRWQPRHLEYVENSNVSGFGEFTTGQKIPLLRCKEKGPVMSAMPTFFPAPLVRGDMIVIVDYQPKVFPFKFTQKFRFVTKRNKDGESRWYPRPLD